ncbi:hypothetical protein ABB02_00295 [Clostridiaceae bacterium JG1575]|nr:hypothetical protein ABB02_00295 [Clostridiaceae bacterium JG1575]
MALAASFFDGDLFAKHWFFWTSDSSLGSYFVGVTASPYDRALKKLGAHRRTLLKKA